MIAMEYGSVRGEMGTAGHEGQIELTSFGFGFDMVEDVAGDTYKQHADCRPIVITRMQDGASPLLLQSFLTGGFDETVTIHFLRTGSDGPVDFLRLRLEGCGISSFRTTAQGDRPMETLTLLYHSFLFTAVRNDNALTGPQDVVGFNLTSQTAV